MARFLSKTDLSDAFPLKIQWCDGKGGFVEEPT